MSPTYGPLDIDPAPLVIDPGPLAIDPAPLDIDKSPLGFDPADVKRACSLSPQPAFRDDGRGYTPSSVSPPPHPIPYPFSWRAVESGIADESGNVDEPGNAIEPGNADEPGNDSVSSSPALAPLRIAHSPVPPMESGSDSETVNDGGGWDWRPVSPVQTAHDDEYDFVHAVMPSNLVLRQAVMRILRETNLEATGMTPADLRRQLEREFALPGGALDNHRARIRAWIEMGLPTRSESPQTPSVASDHTWTFSPMSPTCEREPGDDGWRRVLRVDQGPRQLGEVGDGGWYGTPPVSPTRQLEVGDGGGYDKTLAATAHEADGGGYDNTMGDQRGPASPNHGPDEDAGWRYSPTSP